MSAFGETFLGKNSDNLARRDALDLLVFYLPLKKDGHVSEKDAIDLTCMVLQMITYKQYSLTRRIYTYLFDAPNLEGLYEIDP